MKNTMLPQAELEKVQEIMQKVDELIEVHSNSMPDVSKVQDDLMFIHTTAYLDFLKEFIQSALTLKGLLDISEEDFKNAVTNDGKVSVSSVKREVVLKMMTEILLNR